MTRTEPITTTTTKTDRRHFLRTLAVVVALAALAAALAMSFAAGDAQAKKGKPPVIAFTSNRDSNQEIYTMNADGSNLRNLTNNPASDTEPEISPDGTKIAFVSTRNGILNPEIYVMNADGSNQQRLTKNDDINAVDRYPTWSPDGERIAFASNRDGNYEIYTMLAADGSDQENITHNPARDFAPAYSPAGTYAQATSIAFETNRDGNAEVYFMGYKGEDPYNLSRNPAGDFGPTYAPGPIDYWNRAFTRSVPTQGGSFNYEIYEMTYLGVTQTNLTNNAAHDQDPSYSPDGTKIAFTTDRAGNDEIYSMNRDGSSPTNLTNNAATDQDPDWGVAPPR
jgi:Tol biopolymer transport system component